MKAHIVFVYTAGKTLTNQRQQQGSVGLKTTTAIMRKEPRACRHEKEPHIQYKKTPRKHTLTRKDRQTYKHNKRTASQLTRENNNHNNDMALTCVVAVKNSWQFQPTWLHPCKVCDQGLSVGKIKFARNRKTVSPPPPPPPEFLIKKSWKC